MRDAIREAAEANGRSVSAEIDFRLGLSLALEDDAGGPSTRRLIDFARLASASIQHHYGKPWTEDVEAASNLAGALDLFIRAASPPLPEVKDISANDAEFDRITAELERAREASQRGDPEAAKALRAVMVELMKHMGERETIMAAERNRRLRGARKASALVRLVIGKEVSPEALMGWPSGNQ